MPNVFNYAVCPHTTEYDFERGDYSYTNGIPLHLYKTKEEAESALEIFNPFYNYDLTIVPVGEL